MKPKISVYSFTSCSGCQLQIVHQESILLDILSKVEIGSFALIQKKEEEGPIDIAFIEGGISREDHVEKLKNIRENSKLVVAIGACAVTGGVPSMKNFGDTHQIERIVYKKPTDFKSIPVSAIDKYIKVDFYLRGCPIERKEFTALFKQLLVGQKPIEKAYPVCTECRLKENYCLLNKGLPCMGPVTYCGCDALCTSLNLPCEGCRGMLPDASVESHVEMLREMKISEDNINRLFEKFYGKNPLKEKKEEKEIKK